ncbi:sensor histidine kinase [Paenibacillus cucumis (ex Kampfer et al. 2016)]|uniref:histidine kinase n=1 Tax=Paenibacillus cucumis (ex Kampfer et al. 2016) TaxID=1776858 RepID=A0ABS7KGY9_9BACL|nr:HAMP domain-containing sensor histidine kinase [Paenibacillus cucumis (ex Kampfer et al. 2016)]MBY0203202.1 HAMP domain-containing histidine kinase [Paenibacillus cucumis (ex Kampfer et al. 2016)]
MLSFGIIIFAVNKAIDYYSFITIEKQMMEKADLSELSFREVLAQHRSSSGEPQTKEIVRLALEKLKASGKEVRIYDSSKQLLGLAVDGIIINDGKPHIFEKNIEKALSGSYAYTVTDDHLLYFATPIQNQFYENAYVYEFVEDISYFYAIMDQIRYVLFAGAGGFIVLITLASLWIARNTTKPIKVLLGAAQSFSRQEFKRVHLNRKDELGMLADGLDSMGQQLHNYIQYQKQFVSNVSHELKTPLAAIRGFSQYLYEGENENEELQKIYAHLLQESDRLTRLINELLLLSRFDKAGSSELEVEKTEMNALIQQVARNMEAKAKDKEIRITVKQVEEDQADEGLTKVYASVNPMLMSHAIANLLDNAIKYSGSHSQIDVEMEHTSSEVVVKISDQGIGIAGDELERVQERFYRAKNASTANGSGLGLSICKEIVERFNGYIDIESELGQGTTITIVLPRA